ncbi:MAG TPA: phosphoribosyltransferase family protein [Kiritimatiellia bacterium]|nr:phosphoribosyltransferase family protein [Kiritimatiellia bacterium]HRU69696.1 phosphoribosyltransferase family protein [Kiritimatiellia bacterium]
MSDKVYLSANDYLRDSFRLARMILDSGWQPDDLIVLWRGGAPVGVSVHEFLHYHGLRPRHRVLKCQSYTGIQTREHTVAFENADSIFLSLQAGSRVLVVDDVFDTGGTASAVLERLHPCGVEARIATVYWKPNANQTTLKPDYYVRETDQWIVFPHELDGLTPDEVRQKDPVIFGLLSLHTSAAEQRAQNAPPDRS